MRLEISMVLAMGEYPGCVSVSVHAGAGLCEFCVSKGVCMCVGV